MSAATSGCSAARCGSCGMDQGPLSEREVGWRALSAAARRGSLTQPAGEGIAKLGASTADGSPRPARRNRAAAIQGVDGVDRRTCRRRTVRTRGRGRRVLPPVCRGAGCASRAATGRGWHACSRCRHGRALKAQRPPAAPSGSFRRGEAVRRVRLPSPSSPPRSRAPPPETRPPRLCRSAARLPLPWCPSGRACAR